MTAQMDSYKAENESTTDLIGQDWQKLLDLIERRDGDTDIKSFDGGGNHQRQYKTDENVLRVLQDVKRLKQKDMPLFGHCPETDVFYTVVCSTCGMILMPHALKDHCEKRHGETVDKYGDKSNSDKLKLKKFPPPKLDKIDKNKKLEDVKKLEKKKVKSEERAPNPPQLEPMVTMPKAEKPKVSSKNGVSCSKFPDLQPVVALSPIQVTEIDDKDDVPKKSKRDKKKIDRKIDKIFDPDKHCGVINDNGKPCVRSILCKVHQVALKRAVPNRSMPYDMLTRILKTQNDEDKTKDGLVLIRPKMEEKPVQDTQIIEKNWQQSSLDQVSIKTEEPPCKRLKIKEEEIIEEEGDQNQFVLPSHLEALIDETLKTLKDVEENEQLPVISVAPKPEPLVKWNFEQLPQKSPSPPPHIILDDIHWHSSHPKPLATNTFGCRLIGGLMSTCKKLDTLRKHLQSVWSSSTNNPGNTPIRSFNDIYATNNAQNSNVANMNPKNTFAVSKYSKKPNQNKQVPLVKKNVPSPITKGTSMKRKRKNSGNVISPVQNTNANASDIISGLLISNPVPIQRTGTASVPTIPTGVIPVNSITGNGVPLRLFQGSLPVIASTAPNQPATFIQLNLCPPK